MNAGNSTTCRIRLAKELRELRALARVSAEEAAAELNCSPAKISRLENAKGKVMPRDVRDLLSLYRVGPGPQRDALMAMARKAGEATWWTAYESVLPARLETYVAYETDAARLCTFTLAMVDGLLQTEDYAREVIRAWQPKATEGDVDKLIELRMRRQQVLGKDDPLTVHAIMDEMAIRRPVGGTDVMGRQLDHLVTVVERHPTVTVQIVPLGVGAYAAMNGHFAVIEPRDPTADSVVYVDSPAGNLYVDKPVETRPYAQLFSRLRVLALDPAESLEVLRTAAKEMT